MKSLGLIVEYNPLHNGHIHHIKESKKLVKPDVTIAVMSGHFMQRGEPACTNKWNRAAYALNCGIDLVVELPYAFSNQSADLFATGAISILTHLQATHVVFGSELGNIARLTKLGAQMNAQAFQENIRKKMAKGYSLPAAYAKENPELTGPNNTLGIQYIKAINNLNANITPLTIKRFASEYNDEAPTHDKITSATAIRKMMRDNFDYTSYTPIKLNDAYMKFQNWETHYQFLRHKLLTTTPKELEKIHDMVEGIENRLVNSALESSDFTHFLHTVATKRYTKTRLQRICANVLTGTTKAMIADWNLRVGVQYIRILGFNEKGSDYLRHIKKQIQIPIYSKFGKNVHSMMQHEQQATAAYASVYPGNQATHLMKQEFFSKPIIHRNF